MFEDYNIIQTLPGKNQQIKLKHRQEESQQTPTLCLIKMRRFGNEIN